jgi:hypothetical protein
VEPEPVVTICARRTPHELPVAGLPAVAVVGDPFGAVAVAAGGGPAGADAGVAATVAAVFVAGAITVGLAAGIIGSGSVLTTIGAVLRALANPRADPVEMVAACELAELGGGVLV